MGEQNRCYAPKKRAVPTRRARGRPRRTHGCQYLIGRNEKIGGHPKRKSTNFLSLPFHGRVVPDEIVPLRKRGDSSRTVHPT
ncbi:hypothetical protein GWI33_019703 [Rhynchophorus ferrugineus]|uniref:Uncharacterized protein n=1 Tax=Rhynchophorus ferrugineus TaxID=354439 RepID=A0A834M517_RHYFE|nr:hypothetical protein GWI33_019703 [Rhynchophorus ferrugineus]